MSWQTVTRRKFVPVQSKTYGSESPLKFELSKAGVLGGIYLAIRGSISGTLSNLNAHGKASVIRQVRGYVNTGLDLFQFSGAQYHYLIRDHLEDYKDPVPSSDARSAVAAAAYNLDMYIPVAVSAIDVRGLLVLESEKIVATLTVEFEDPANVAMGATITGTVTPFLEIFTLPPKPEDRPPFNTVHQLIAETRVVGGAGEIDYPWPLGNMYLQMLHGLGFGVSGADGWSQAILRAATDRLYQYTPISADLEFARWHGRARLPGTLPIDLLGSDGLGVYGGDRDALFSSLTPDLKTTITATGVGTLHSVRRQLVAID